jgi:hypothetical protein
MNLQISDQFINDYSLFAIEGIIICISEYIGKECYQFLNFLNKNSILEYLYTCYDLESIVECKKIRYLKNVTSTSDVSKYKNVIKIQFDDKFDQKIKENELPNSLQSLTFGKLFNQKIESNVLPISLHSLTFGYRFNQKIEKNVIPNSVQYLTFGEKFNQEIKQGVLPSSLQHLIFALHFNQEIKENVLPNLLVSLTFDYYYSRELKKNVLPNSLLIIQVYKNYLYLEKLKGTYENLRIVTYY